MSLLGFSRDRYPASPLARWLLPSNGLGADLQKTSACLTFSIVVWRHRARVNLPSARCMTTVRTRTTENTAPALLAACVLRTLPGSGSIRHTILVYKRNCLFISIRMFGLTKVLSWFYMCCKLNKFSVWRLKVNLPLMYSYTQKCLSLPPTGAWNI
jgi:hypothetical protein